MPAHGASSSHDRRSPTTRSAPTAARTVVDDVAGEAQPVGAPLVAALVRQPGQELAHEAVLAGVDLDAVAVGRDGRPGGRANPSTTAAMSSASIHFGTSRVATSGTRDGAHSGRWL